MLGKPQKTQGCPKEQPVGEQPHHHPWMSWLVTYLADNVWFTCGDPRQTFGKCCCMHLLSVWGIASRWGQSPDFQTDLGTVHWGPHPGSCWSSETARGPRLPHPNHATRLIHPSLWQPIPATGMAWAGWWPGCSALWLPLQRGRELGAAKGPEWATCEVAGYAGDKCVPLMGMCFSDLL